jgi:hypothetical protein
VRGEIPESEAGAGHEIPDESLIVGEQWGLANVFVYLPEAPEGFASPVLFESTVTIDIADGRFVPHALIIRTPVTVRARSRDPEAYNPQLYGIRNPPVGLILSPEGPAPQRLPKPEFVPLAMTCDIHPQMRAWVLPLDHPFAALTGRDGAFRIDGLPPGEHTFRVWHERSGWLEKALNVSIEAGNEAQVTLEYGASRFSEREP